MGNSDGTTRAESLADLYDSRLSALYEQYSFRVVAAREQYSKRLLEIDGQRNEDKRHNDKVLEDAYHSSNSDLFSASRHAQAEVQSRSNYNIESATAARQLKTDVLTAGTQIAEATLRMLT